MKVNMDPDANIEGSEQSPNILAFAYKVADLAGLQTLNIKTGTNAPPVTSTGYASDHVTGNALDIEPANDAEGDKIAATALTVAGVPAPKAMAAARAGGLWTIPHQGFSIQVAWKTYEGGDHHLCVHLGIEAGDGPSAAAPVTHVTRRRTGVPADEAAVVEVNSPGAFDRRGAQQ